MKVKLTQKYIDHPLPVPPDKAKVEHCDIALPGLLWEQRAINQEWGSYRLRYKNSAGKTSYATVGRSCEITLAEARQKVKQLKAEIQLGSDPQHEVRKRRKGLLWETFFTEHYLPHAKQHKRSWGNDEEMHRLRINDRFGSVKLSKITRHAVQQFHNELRESGLAPGTCDHYLKLIRQALNLAVSWELLDTNPVAKIKLFHISNEEERLMSEKQLRQLMEVLDSDHNQTVCLAIKLMLFTGARVNQTLHARWSEINRDSRIWAIPAIKNKSKQRHSIPLSDAALSVLDQLDSEGKSEWLFNSSRGGRLRHISKVWARLRRAAGLEGTLEGGLNLRLHDTRHAAASAMVSSGQSLYVVQKILGHSDPSVTQRYAHLSTEALQDAANCISTYVDNALEKADE
jgi:integrase